MGLLLPTHGTPLLRRQPTEASAGDLACAESSYGKPGHLPDTKSSFYLVNVV